MLGLSVYPENASIKDIKDYLDLGKKTGFRKLFLSFLQIDPKRAKESLETYRLIIDEAKKQGYTIVIDFVPQLFDLFGQSYQDLGFLKEMGVDVLRFDAGLTGKEEATMSKNPYGIIIELNMSEVSHQLDRICDFNPNRRQLSGSHNFFPQKYTGLSKEQFKESSLKFRAKNLNTTAFVTSQVAELGPWPLQEGLCTVEEHRSLPIELQTRDLLQSGLVDDIIVGNMFASEAELKAVSKAAKEAYKFIEIELAEEISDFEKEILFNYRHHYRSDSSDYMIRSTRIRSKVAKLALPPVPNSQPRINVGDILILNEDYGQYKGEVQIALKERANDPRINIVGRIPKDQWLLVENIKRNEEFEFRKVDDQNE